MLDRERIQEIVGVWPLLLRDPDSLTDDQITDLIRHQDSLSAVIVDLHQNFPIVYRRLQKRRNERLKLTSKSTDFLRDLLRFLDLRRGGLLDGDPESNGLDFRRNIIRELLSERGALEMVE